MKVRKTIDKEFEGLGDRIQAARKESAKPLTELAYEAGMSVVNWHRIEKEEPKVLPEETLRAIEYALGINLGVQFDEEE
ncbi:MAG: helix-turn-helix domain-containing protein [Cyanobacteria bacterium SBLK]|nr:helix-turn-helix domain-containing protein [Cyanobacteria bacterium SBLK]